jgi:hypothetical protein
LINEPAREVICHSFTKAKGGYETEYGGGGLHTKFLFCKFGEDTPLESNHSTNKSVDENQQRKLLPILTESKFG